MSADAVEVKALVHAAHRGFRRRRLVDGLDLYAGASVLSPSVQASYDSFLGTHPALGRPGEKLQPAVNEIETLEELAAAQLRRAFNARYVEYRFLSGSMANLGVFCALTEPGSTIGVLSPQAGGHSSHHTKGTAGVRGLRAVFLPFDHNACDISWEELDGFVDEVRPRLLMVGGSVSLFAHDLGRLRAAADRVGACVVYDVSHVAGLIAAGTFPNPLDGGADILTMSTYKTLAGPAGGVTATRSAVLGELLSNAAYPILSSNFDASRLGPLSIATSEAIEQNPPWAALTIKTAQLLAEHLSRLGLTVLGAKRGFTQTHQLVVDVSALGGGRAAARCLELNGIYAGECWLPTDTPTGSASGLRIGTQTIVRSGAAPENVPLVAELIAKVLTHDQRPDPNAARAARLDFGPDLWGRPPYALSEV